MASRKFVGWPRLGLCDDGLWCYESFHFWLVWEIKDLRTAAVDHGHSVGNNGRSRHVGGCFFENGGDGPKVSHEKFGRLEERWGNQNQCWVGFFCKEIGDWFGCPGRHFVRFCSLNSSWRWVTRINAHVASQLLPIDLQGFLIYIYIYSLPPSSMTFVYNPTLGGGLKHVVSLSLLGEMIQFDGHIFQLGWFSTTNTFVNRLPRRNETMTA